MFSFGGNNTSTSTASAPTGGFSFGGATASTPSTSTTNSTSLFGNTSNTASNPATSTAPTSGFSFGSTSSAPSTSTTANTPSLFGNTSSISTGTSLFGNTSGSTPTSTTFSLSTPSTTGSTSTRLTLGSTTTSSAPSASLFGNTTSGGSAFNVSTTNTSTSSAPLNPQTIVRTTKFSELPEDAKKMIEQIEKSIQSQIHSYDYVTARETPDFINKVSDEAQALNEKLVGLKFSLERDMELISNLNKTMNREIKNAEIAGRGINALKSPNNHLIHFPGVRLTFDYFWNLVTSFESRMLQYKHNIEDIEKHLSSIAQTAKFSPGALTEIMRNQHETFLAIAGKVAKLHSAVKRQKELCLNYRRRIYNDDKNPFSDDLKKSQKIPKPSDDSESLMISMLQPTSSANQPPQGSNSASSNLFGNTTQATGSTFGANTGSLFGQSSTSPFGSSTSTSATGGGLFGSTTPTTSANNTFGTSGGLFGNASTPTSNTTSSTGGLFGSSTTAPSTGGLFGATTSAPSSGGLFGGSSTTTPSTGGLFGSNNNATKPATGFTFGAK